MHEVSQLRAQQWWTPWCCADGVQVCSKCLRVCLGFPENMFVAFAVIHWEYSWTLWSRRWAQRAGKRWEIVTHNGSDLCQCSKLMKVWGGKGATVVKGCLCSAQARSWNEMDQIACRLAGWVTGWVLVNQILFNSDIFSAPERPFQRVWAKGQGGRGLIGWWVWPCWSGGSPVQAFALFKRLIYLCPWASCP